MPEMLKFDSPKNQAAYIKVIGVGGGGSNAVTHMYKQGIKDVDFILCNTDAQALESSPIPNKIQLGTKGLGAGSIPLVGKEAALENAEEIRAILEHSTKMLFITAGMGGGTGTGAAPVIAEIAKELDILTVGIVTIPFSFEGRKRKQQAEKGIEELRDHVDTLLVISNDKVRELYGNLKLSEAFSKADNILSTAAKGIAEIITVPGYINVDFEDVNTVMRNSGVAIMGTGVAEGENRAITAAEEAISSPLLNDNDIQGADNILLYIGSGKDEIYMDEVTEITDFIRDKAGPNAEIIWGNGIEENLEQKISVTLIATGFHGNGKNTGDPMVRSNTTRIVHTLEDAGLTTEEIPDKKDKKVMINEITLINKNLEKNMTEKKSDSGSDEIPFSFNHHPPGKEEKSENEPSENTSSGPEIDDRPKETDRFFNLRTHLHNDNNNPENELKDAEKDEIERRAKERINRLKELSTLLKSPTRLNEMENEPAYVRKNVKLTDPIPSNSNNVAKYTLGTDDNDNTEIRSNNSFLHDNVD